KVALHRRLPQDREVARLPLPQLEVGRPCLVRQRAERKDGKDDRGDGPASHGCPVQLAGTIRDGAIIRRTPSSSTTPYLSRSSAKVRASRSAALTVLQSSRTSARASGRPRCRAAVAVSTRTRCWP